jgi:hypothetical protein
MNTHNMYRDAIQLNSRPGHDPTRDKAGCRAVLEYFRSLPRNLSNKECPSSLELIRDGRFGQRPVNRINDLVLGKFDGHCYDFERIRCGRGEFHWRLHEPNRAGYPKHKQQTILPLTKSWEQVCAERDRKLRERGQAPELVLTP